ncbi:MAG: substrate-binding domain-containing protein, partial [Lachnospiraceae bacterium]|nr:substrate-binding domain-containing protein [Lachnospiraceae bacterium]
LQLEVASGGLPVVFVNTMPATDRLKPDQYMYVGSYERDAGRFQAEYVWDTLGHPKELNAIIFEGQQGHAATIGRTGAVKEFFRDNGVNANFVFCDYATWSDEIAAEKFNVFLKTKQDFDAVFCNNDTMALGVVRAMKENGFSTKDIPVCGVDATEGGCQSIADGEMQFTVYQSASGQGTMSVKTAAALATSGTAKDIEGLSDDGKIVWVPFEKVDASNVKNYQ